jgi:hypothetical protein
MSLFKSPLQGQRSEQTLLEPQQYLLDLTVYLSFIDTEDSSKYWVISSIIQLHLFPRQLTLDLLNLWLQTFVNICQPYLSDFNVHMCPGKPWQTWVVLSKLINNVFRNPEYGWWIPRVWPKELSITSPGGR